MTYKDHPGSSPLKSMDATKSERSSFRKYHDLTQDFARELTVTNDKVNVRRLAALREAIVGESLEYQILVRTREVHGTD